MVHGEPVQFRPASTLQDGANPLLPGRPISGYSIPCVTDWNGDGKKDLLVGYQDASQIAVYLNQGTDAQPSFNGFSVLKTGDGNVIKFLSTGCGSPACWVCDFDKDGKRDLLVGAGTGGIYFFRNTNSDAAPILTNSVTVKTNLTDPILVGIRPSPYVCDWDEDGLDDLLIGCGDGYVYFFKNTNSASAPIFAPGQKLQAGGTNLFLAGGGTQGVGRSVARVFDLDGDGLKDLVCSSDGGVYWCRNTNNNSTPILQGPLPILAPVSGVGLTNIITDGVPGSRMRVDLVDWNNDGVIDIILGHTYGTVYYYEGYHFRTTVAAQPTNLVVVQWNSASYLNFKVLTNAHPGDTWSVAATNVASGGNSTSWTNQMGGGPQFFRIQVAQ